MQQKDHFEEMTFHTQKWGICGIFTSECGQIREGNHNGRKNLNKNGLTITGL